MRVLKFGGTSVGSAERIRKVVDIINDGTPKIVVLSAVSGTTNKLQEIITLLYQKYTESAHKAINDLRDEYDVLINDLYTDQTIIEQAKSVVHRQFDEVLALSNEPFSLHEERIVLAKGELISTELFQFFLEQENIASKLIPALSFMRIDKDDEPDKFYIKENITRILQENNDVSLFITQGYICRNVFGGIDNLKRGGSDYSATLIGGAINAEEIQIWTDIDGMHNNDPRIVDNTKPIEKLSFNEAAELAYFGAKILHPSSVRPAQEAGIPVWLKNTFDPEAHGTLISAKSNGQQIKAIAAKDGITAIKIRSGRMLMAYGFLRKIFEIFERYKTPIDMITTSEVAVSLTIDDTTNLDQIIEELNDYGVVEIDESLSIICIVGDLIADSKGQVAIVLNALTDVPIRMVSYGGSSNNISLLVRSEHKENALIALNKSRIQSSGGLV